MPLSLKLPRRNPDAPRPSLRERYHALKGSAAKVIGKPPKRAQWPQLKGGSRPSKPLTDLITAHNLAYARCLENMNEGGADLVALRAAEEEAFRALLHAPLISDADRGSYAAAVIERENGFLVRGYAGTRNDPLSIAYRNLRFREHAPEPAQEAEPKPVEAETAPPSPSARFDAYDRTTGLVTYADAAGTVRAKPAAEWLSFMAMRLHHVAQSERTRQFNAVCNDLDGAASAELETRLTRELRIDALHALMFRSDQVFAEAQDLRDGGDGAGASAAKVDLRPLTVLQLVNLHEAYRAAQHLWDGIGARPYSIASRDQRGCIHMTMAGKLAEFEEARAALVGDRIVDEITSRSPQNDRERDYILSLRLQHEIDCEGRIRDADMMREISQAWGA
ncbi:hypothetical protein FF100_04000 [Methylobacterium terricola]|uniref:Uncharacterized protein n=1 Tax=Methylobacterium terricola TaxID=2583531 RepID=A0A5C4LTS1_9HYPH|nr:hypothetical protein [Methylobacterium terricola]TNC16417.1 hypothetical protein FF100_04000 [Methylobacterium terricola]